MGLKETLCNIKKYKKIKKMKKNIRLTESDLYRIVRKVIKEQQTDTCISPATPKTLMDAHKVMKEMGFSCSNSSGGPGSEDGYQITYTKVISNGTLSLTVTDSNKVVMMSYKSDKFNIKQNQPFKFDGNTIYQIEEGIGQLYVVFE